MIIRRKQDIPQLDVSVNNPLLVNVVDRGGEFREPLENSVLVQFGGLDVRKRTGLAVFGKDM